MQRPIAIIFFCLSCLTGSQAWAGNSNNLPHRLIFPLSAFVSPTADASNTQTEYTDEDDNGSEEVSLDASNSSDADGTIESYVWTENNVEIATGETADVELAVGVHNITLTVTDDDGDSDTDNVVITITEAENQAPTANAGQDQSISDEDDNGSEEVSLDASNSSDADGTIESYVWTEGGNQIATGINPDVTLDVGVHNITLTVTDDDGDSDTDNVVITITEPANTPPTADASNTQTEYTDEDDNGSEEVSLDASNSSDADGTIESYVWTENNVEIATGETADVELAVGVHNITLTVTDDDGDSDTDNVVITITEAENQAPTANAGQDQSISDEDDNGSEEVSLDASNSSDADGTIESYVWTEGGNQIATGINPDVTLNVGVHNITLTVTDDDGDSDTDNVVITITEAENQAPTANAGQDQSISDEDGNGSEEVSLDASNSSDADGTIESYVWTEGGNQIATGETADVELNVGVHNITLTVTDDDGDSDTDNVVITITEAENQAPTADAGQDQSISDEDDNGSESVELDGSGSSDADGTIESYVWTENNVEIATGETADVDLNVGVHNITLTVTDDDEATDTDNVVITITEAENQPPTADAGQDQSISDEDGNGSEEVTLNGSASSDADGTITDYVWTEGGNQIATGETADVELAVGVHNITLTVTDDDGDSDTDNVVITITEAENQAPTANAGQDQSISDEDDNGSESVELDGSGSSDDDGTIESYVWTENNVEIATGETADVDLNVGVHNITLTVTDDDGDSDTDNVVITITEPANTPPTADASNTQTEYTDEDDNGSEEVSLDASNSSDADGTIESYVWTEGGNQIATGINPDVTLDVGVHNITLTVTDDDGDSDTDNVVITITEAENQAPTADAGQDQSISDEDDNGSESVELDGSGSSDDDGTIESYVWTENNVEIATGETADVDLNVGVHNITLTVTDDDGDSDTDNVVITITEPANTPPTADASNTQTEYTDEDDNGSEEVSLDASNSSDADGTIESYVWTEGGNQIATGINPDVTLDVGVHNITLTVTDDDGDSDTDNVVITITEAENQAPTANAGQDQSISDEDDNGSESVELDGSGSSDADGTITDYVWTEGGNQIATGETADVDLNVGVHNITLTVTDDDGDSDTDNVVITITEPANTPPTADASNTQTEYTDEDDNGSEEVSLDASNSSDADGTIESYVWTEGGNQIATGETADVDLNVGVHNITLTVTDDDGDSDTDNVVITITEAENQAPTANAGQDQSISDEDDNGSESVELDGSGSSDDDGTIESYVWTENNVEIATGETADVDLNVGVHNITLTVTDDDGDSDTDNVVITITEAENQAPTADAGQDQSISDEDDNGSESVELDGSGSSDDDGTIESYVWTENNVEIATGETADVDLNVGVHNITLTVTDDDGDSDTDNVVITITEAENQPPTANAGQDQSISDEDDNGSEEVGLDASNSSDADGTIESYVWTEGGNQIATGETADVELAVGVHNITLTVTDDDGDSDTDNVVITITEAENQAPTADAGQDQSISDEDDNGSESVELDGSGSSDADGTIESYVWTENNVEIATGETADVDLNVGVHNITLTVTDDDEATDTDNVVITITEAENQPPTADAGQDQSISDEDGNGSEEVTLNGSASSDADGTITDYVWTEGGNQIATGETADVELAVGVHNITLTVTDDDGDSDTDNVVITITEAENQAPTANAGQDQSISDEDDNGSESVELDGSGSSDDDGTIESYVWTENNVEIATGETADVDLNVGVHNITLTVTDDDGDSDTDNVVITITEPANTPPTADASNTQTEYTDEDDNGSEEVSLDASNSSDADGTIESYVWTEGGNQIATGINPDVTLDVGVHNITLTVTDDDGDSDTDNVVITITEAENQAPTADAGQDQSISDEDDNGSESVELDGSGSSDDDGTIESYVWTENNVEIATGETADVDLNVGVHNITLTVTDDDGDSDTDNVVVVINEPETQTPFFSLVQEIFEANEDFNSAVTVAVQPDDESQEVSYSILPGSIDFATLTADNSNGIYEFESLADRNGEQEFTITATAEDDPGNQYAQNFTFRVNAVNDQPVFNLAQNNVNVEAASGARSITNFAENIAPGPATATDEASQTLAFTATATDQSLFAVQPAISNNGTLTFTPADDNIGSTAVEVILTDSGPNNGENQNSSSTTFTFAVTEQPNAEPEAEPESYTFDEDNVQVITLEGFDEDNDPLTYYIESLPINGTLTVGGVEIETEGEIEGKTVTYTPNPDYNGTDAFTFAVSDGTEPNSNVATIGLNIDPVNDAPTFTIEDDDIEGEYNAASEQTFPGFASEIEDVEGQELEFILTPADGNTLTFTQEPAIDAASGDLTFVVANNSAGIAGFTVVLSDGDDESSLQSFTIVVQAPEVEAPSNITLTPNNPVDENDEGAFIGDLSAQGTQPISFSLPEGEANNELFTINNGNELFTNGALDFETVGASLTVVVQATNGNGNTTQNFDIEVTNEEEPPTSISLDGNTIEDGDASGTTVGTLSAQGGAPVPITFSLTNALDNSNFSIQNDNQLVTAFTADYDSKSSYQVEVQAQGDGDFEQTFNISVNPPVIVAPTTITLNPTSPTVAENDENALVGTLSADGTAPISFSLTDAEDNDFFTINGNQLFVDGSLDFETVGASLTVVVQATNGNGNTTQNFDIEVTNEEEPPTSISLDGNTIEDGDASGTTVGTLSAQGGASETVTFSLPEGEADNSNFSIQNDNQLVTAFTADYDSKSSYQVEVQAQGDGDFEQTFNISVNPPVIVAPTTITLNPTSPTVAENDENALVGTLSADGTAPISFSLTDAEDNDFFTINGNQLFVDGSLDFETVGASLTVVVQATNGNGNTTQNFDIEVTNEEEPPTSISLDGNTIEDGDASGTTVGTLSAQGGASETVTFSLPEGEADNSNFSIQNDNQLVTAFTADYDSKSSYQVEVQAQGDGDFEQTFNISVNSSCHSSPYHYYTEPY
ncbi:translation elongation factor EF-1beta [Catalinimonas alkaloidigena]|uniref:beta strand repeat-containing protein n=1 Tax=Catalinimonas alkaloidigena TaxID=1075417 RepID=UPI002404BEB5|nr:PKD domain-containing protein [Catalinimonas alkaloidigena]MDF9798449.1 translation elongation factor EF-1beta [Catalinimonas alkaloidigena]